MSSIVRGLYVAWWPSALDLTAILKAELDFFNWANITRDIVVMILFPFFEKHAKCETF
ncbi:hypothetical protein FWK35_00001473, partial [Aphis craccivora]